MSDPVVVDELSIQDSSGRELFRPTSFSIAAGTVTALTGPSGSGKTTLLRGLLGHLPQGANRATGTALVAGQEVFALRPIALQRFRREHVAYVGQDPGSALNPLMRVRSLLDEVAHRSAAVLETLELVGLSAEHLRRRPGELSGGQQRRVALARALVRRTGILILDEPLAGLHGSLRGDIARLLLDIATERSVAILLSGHDIATLHAVADEVVELGSGIRAPYVPVAADSDGASSGMRAFDPGFGEESSVRVTAENGSSRRVLASGSPTSESRAAVLVTDGTVVVTDDQPSASITHRLPGSAGSPRRRFGHGLRHDGTPPVAIGGAVVVETTRSDRLQPLLSVRAVCASIAGHEVLTGIDLDLHRGSALAVVGASGAGKTTLARVVAGLHHPTSGSIELRGAPISAERGRPRGEQGIQLITQNPRSALNPRRTVAQTIGRPLRRIGRIPKKRLAQHINELLAATDLQPELAERYPHELSGGQRQRVALARALAARPEVLVCDEITSALDQRTATSIMSLLDRIRTDHDTGVLVITHDMPLVAGHCSRVVVLDHGHVVESGSVAAVLETPKHSATRELFG